MRRSTLLRPIAVALCALLLAGCAAWRPATGPMETRLVRATCGVPADTLVVLLPGAYSTPDEFEREGFLAELQRRRVRADAMLVDAHLGYYRNKTIVERIRTDVLAPARAAGYRSVWLVGISLGGFGALLTDLMLPGEAAGLVLLAPYLGEQALLASIEAGGGLRAWTPPAGDATELRLWRRLQARAGDTAMLPPLYLGFGLDDRLGQGHRLLAAGLPPGRVYTTPGGHDWPEWLRLWQQVLAQAPLPRCD